MPDNPFGFTDTATPSAPPNPFGFSGTSQTKAANPFGFSEPAQRQLPQVASPAMLAQQTPTQENALASHLSNQYAQQHPNPLYSIGDPLVRGANTTINALRNLFGSQDATPDQQYVEALANKNQGLGGQVLQAVPPMLASATPVSAAMIAAGQARDAANRLQQAGQPVSKGASIGNELGQAGLAGLTSLLPGSHIAEGLLAKLALGAGAGAGYNAASNAITKGTINPQQRILQGTIPAAILGAGAGAAAHLLPEKPAQATETTPKPLPIEAQKTFGKQLPLFGEPNTSGRHLPLFGGPNTSERQLPLFGESERQLPLFGEPAPKIKAQRPVAETTPKPLPIEAQKTFGKQLPLFGEPNTSGRHLPLFGGPNTSERQLPLFGESERQLPLFGEQRPSATQAVAPPQKPSANEFTDKNALDKWTQVADSLQRAQAGKEFDIHKAVSNLKPFQDAAAKLSDSQFIKFVDDVDKYGKSDDHPELAPAAKLHTQMNTENKKTATDLGFNTKDWENSYVRFLARPKEEGGWLPDRGGLLGDEGYLRFRKSPDFASFVDAINKHNLELPTKNAVNLFMLGDAQIAKSLNMRKMLVKDWLPAGLAQNIGRNDPLPADYVESPSAIRTDPFLNPEGEEGKTRLVFHKDAARYLDWYLQTHDQSGPGMMLGAARTTRYALDAFYAYRAITGQAGWSMSNLLRGGMEALRGNAEGAKEHINAADPISQYMRGRKVLTNSIEGLRSDPTTAPLAHHIEQIMKEGGFRTTDLEKAPLADREAKQKTGAWWRRRWETTKSAAKFVPNMLNRHVTAPLKIGAAIKMSEIADHMESKYQWSPLEKQESLTNGVKSLNRLLGSAREVKPLPKELSALMTAITPTVNYHTDAYRLLGAGIKQTTQGKGIRSQLPEGVGGVLGYVAANAVAMAAMTEAVTGTAQWPQDIKDLFFGRTGRYEKDGTPERLAIPGIFDPLAKDIAYASGGQGAKIISAWAEPFFRSSAEAIQNENYRGEKIGNVAERIAHALWGGASTMIPDTSKGIEEFLEGAAGLRKAPGAIERGAKDQEMYELRGERSSLLRRLRENRQEEIRAANQQ